MRHNKSGKTKKNTIMNKVIWSFWINHSNNYEEEFIVSQCFKSWNYYCKDWKIIILNYNNYKDWILEIPEEIRNSNITIQTDYFRLYLLYNYGGVWMDSSIFLFESIDFFFKDNQKIVFFLEEFNKNDYIYSNWFIASLEPKKKIFKKCLEEMKLCFRNTLKYKNHIETQYDTIYNRYIRWCHYIRDSIYIEEQTLYTPSYFYVYLILLKIIDTHIDFKQSIFVFKSLNYARYHKKLSRNFKEMIYLLSRIPRFQDTKMIKFNSIERKYISEIIKNKTYNKNSVIDYMVKL